MTSDSGDLSSVTEQLTTASLCDDARVTISFAGQSLKLNSETDAQVIVDAISSCVNLNILELKGNTLGVDAAAAIGKALEKQKEFKRALWSDLFTGRMKTEIPPALKVLCGGLMTAGARLVELDLSDNAFGPNGMIGLVDFLKSSSCYALQELRLNNNGLGIQGGLMLADSLVECHTRSVEAGTPLALRIFVSGRGRLEDDGAIALSKAFKLMHSLVEVHMPQNGINHRGITALADAFAVNKRLKHINLSDNTFTKRGSLSMATAIRQLDEVEVINFDDCLMRTDGAKALAASIKNRLPNLTTLKLSGNEINCDGAEAIIDALTHASKLKELDLNANQLGVEGVEVVLERMKAAGKSKILASLSDDEGSEDENDEEDNDDADNEEEEVEDGVGKANDGDDSKDINELDLRLTDQATISARPACEPEPVDTTDPEKALDAFMKISSTVPSTADEKALEVAYTSSDAILSRLFATRDDSSTNIICNTLLVNLGLIKDEDRKYRTPSNIASSLTVLNHSVAQPYFPQPAKDMLKVFIEKSSSKLDECAVARDQLLKTLQPR